MLGAVEIGTGMGRFSAVGCWVDVKVGRLTALLLSWLLVLWLVEEVGVLNVPGGVVGLAVVVAGGGEGNWYADASLIVECENWGEDQGCLVVSPA